MKLKEEIRAFELMTILLEGPKDKPSILDETGWSTHQFIKAKNHLRGKMCPQVGAILPRPTHDDGYLYHLIDAEHPDRPAFWRGSDVSVSDARSRLNTIARLFAGYLGLVDGRTSEGKTVKLIEMKLRHLFEELDIMDEINEELERVSA